jgi:hypothetical protein
MKLSSCLLRVKSRKKLNQEPNLLVSSLNLGRRKRKKGKKEYR